MPADLHEELRLMAKVAHLYYERNLSQTAIAGQLELSQATISRLLKRAHENGIVQVSVVRPQGFFAQLEDTLQSHYQLKDVIIVDAAPGDDDETIQRALGSAAAFYVQNTLKPDEIVGLSSWSATLLAMVDAMHALPRSMNTTVVQILGGIGNPSAKVHANRLTERLAQLIHGRAVFLPVPGVAPSEEARQMLVEDVFTAECLAMFDKVTMALVGIGDVEPSKMLASSGNRFTPEELAMLREHGAVGDICMRFFDDTGAPVRLPLDRRVISMTLEELRRVPRSVGIAGGKRKLAAIRGALRGGWINVLITDRGVAEQLVAEIEG
jgi:DNA-binding transcriptional regulator LsrR (DeoR family)